MNSSHKDDIKEILKHLKKGKRDAFDQIFSLYSNRIYRLAKKMQLNHEEAEEVVQDVFMVIWEKRESIDPEKDFKAYLFKIAKSYVIKVFKKKALFFAYERYIQKEDYLDCSTENLIHYHSLLEFLEKEIQSLPEARKEIFTLSRNEGFSAEEIADKLGISKRTVENQLYRTLKLLKDRIKSRDLLIISFILLS